MWERSMKGRAWEGVEGVGCGRGLKGRSMGGG